MSKNVSGTITAGGTAQSLFSSTALSILQGYEVENTSSGTLYIEDSGAVATTSSRQIASGASYASPPFKAPLNGVSIYGDTTGQTFVASVY